MKSVLLRNVGFYRSFQQNEFNEIKMTEDGISLNFLRAKVKINRVILQAVELDSGKQLIERSLFVYFFLVTSWPILLQLSSKKLQKKSMKKLACP